ncbi:MAG: serine/threonine protein kinase, partial [Myxococcales bacterium]|nr:serine/threonine protein kinase [Myxococcales bacterium]
MAAHPSLVGAQQALGRADLIARDALTAMLFGGPREPDRIGRYRIVRVLGEGGMGVVFHAHDDELARPVALKVLHEHRDAGATGRARLVREAQAMAQLSHPNVVQVHDVGEHEGQVFLAMELIRGETLRAWVEELGAAPGRSRRWREIVAMFVQAGRGLAAAHDAGLVHRDFKPANALVGEDGRVRV